tara:strand:- start:738 stop:1982 length:1245 start_codon:yes stop_codon:yes gene_type:complete
MEEKVQVQAVPEAAADTMPQNEEQVVLEQAVESGEVDKDYGLQDDGVYKVNLDKPLNTEENAIQERETTKVSVDVPSEDSKEVDSEVRIEPSEKETKKEEVAVNDVPDSPLQLIEDEEKTKEIEEPINLEEEKIPDVEGRVLPENIDKLVNFMEETGGSVEDYVSLNRDVSKMDNVTLLREFYKNTKPHLDADDVEFLLNKNFAFDGEADDPQEVKAKQLAFKEELFNAQKHFKSSKEKYYADLKLRKQNDIPPEQREAIEHYDSYKQQKAESEVKIERFKQQTDKVFNKDFKGFDFKVGENKYRYKVDNPQKVKEFQYSINNWIGTHLDDKGNVKDVPGYHKSLFAAQNADKIAGHFYEQGRADAIRESAKKAKNINMDPRKDNASMQKTNTSGIRAISNDDNPNKLRVKWNK